jgi:hypothetical protein
MADQTWDFDKVTVRKRDGQPNYELGVTMDGAFIVFGFASEGHVAKWVGLAKIAADNAPPPPPAQ